MGICFECRVDHVRTCQTNGGAPSLPSERAFDIVVIGAGPAGLAAAKRAAQAGARTAIVDDNPNPGGQIWRAGAKGITPEAQAWLTENVTHICGQSVVAAPAHGRLTLDRIDIEYSRLILATGAHERFLPFPGWTLPNVMGAGGLQAMAKSGLPIVGKRVVVAGSGPLLLAVAKYMREHGANVRLIAEQASHPDVIGFGLKLTRYPGKLSQALQLKWQLAGIRQLTSCWPIAAHGADKLESVTLRRRNTTWNEPCDYLACGFGLIPNLELPALLGCRIGKNGVDVDEFQETSVPNIYAAGEVTGIGGLDLALAEGEIAGLAAAGRHDDTYALFAARSEHRVFAEALEQAFALRPELRQLPSDETFLCRCEDVTYGRVKECTGWREAKLHTRCGMGPCQGRVCGGAVDFLLGWKADSIRPPVFAAPIGAFTRDNQ
jgi:NADPH-dependent 2,4-dienoyl-CoA reductase/sulfur reductase-like enzyme